MAEDPEFSDDISALWTDQEETFAPPLPEAGERAVDEEVADDAADGAARLAQSLAVQQTDVVSRAELERVRSEMEGAFTHELAAALYELLRASNDRFASIERRLDDIASRLHESVAGHVAKLAAELGRLADAVEGQRSEAVLRADDDIVARRQLTERVGRAAAGVSAKLEDISARVTSLQRHVAALHDTVAQLRRALPAGRIRRLLTDRYRRGAPSGHTPSS